MTALPAKAHTKAASWPKITVFVSLVISITFILVTMKYPAAAALLLARFSQTAYLDQRQATATSSKVPDYFQTTPELFAGMPFPFPIAR